MFVERDGTVYCCLACEIEVFYKFNDDAGKSKVVIRKIDVVDKTQ